MIDVFDDSILKRRAHRDVIKQRQMLHVFAKPDAAACGQTGTPNFAAIRSTPAPRSLRQTTTVDLTKTDCLPAEAVEDDAVLTSFAGGHTDRRQRLRDLRMPEHVIG